MKKYGLVGKDISYSFSRTYFREKFQELQIDSSYENFDLQDIGELGKVLENNPELRGLNVTIPFKEKIIPFLDQMDSEAEEIGAVNTIKFLKNGNLKGFNTDHSGFREALEPLLQEHHKKALILGTGGASKAVKYALESLNIDALSVSRSRGGNRLLYEDLDEIVMREHSIIINCTPLGTSPNISAVPDIPFKYITPEHLVFDLIYNPKETRLMLLAAEKGATVTNGLRMLELQAEKAWEIWTAGEK